MTAFRDTELLELFEGRPALLAIADAVAETQARRGRARRRPRTRPLLAAAAVAAGVLAALLVVPWDGHGPGAVGRALAALGDGRVVHAVLRYQSPDEQVVDLSTGVRSPRVHTIEYWWDAEGRTLRTRLATDGRRLTEIVETPSHAWTDIGDFPTGGGFAPGLDPGLAGFATGYREALAAGTARTLGHTSVDGRDAVTLQLQLPHDVVEDVDVDASTYVPLRIRTGHMTFDVTTIESVPYAEDLFAHPAPSAARPTGGVPGFVGTTETVPPAAVPSRLGGPAVWLGDSFRGTPVSATVQTTEATLTDGSTAHGVAATLVYGDVRISESDDAAGAYTFGMDDGGDPPPPPGSVALGAAPGGRAVHGEMQDGPLRVAIDAPDAATVVAAARALTAIG